MQWWEYLIIAICIIFVVGVIILSILLKRKGKSLLRDCTGNCKTCGQQCSGKTCEQLLKEYRKSQKLEG